MNMNLAKRLARIEQKLNLSRPFLPVVLFKKDKFERCSVLNDVKYPMLQKEFKTKTTMFNFFRRFNKNNDTVFICDDMTNDY